MFPKYFAKMQAFEELNQTTFKYTLPENSGSKRMLDQTGVSEMNGYTKMYKVLLLLVLLGTAACKPFMESSSPQTIPVTENENLITPQGLVTADLRSNTEILVEASPSLICVSTGISPSPRSGHDMVYDQKRERIVLFGGRPNVFNPVTTDTAPHENETWEYDGCNWEKIETENKPPRMDEIYLVYDSQLQRTVLLGYVNVSTDVLAEMWVFDGVEWHQLEDVDEFPTPRVMGDAIYDSKQNWIVLFGGMGINPYTDWLRDTWIFDGNDWQEITHAINYVDELLPSGEFPVMTYDEKREKTVLLSPKFGNTTSEFDGFSWDNLNNLPNQNNRPVMPPNDMRVFLGDVIFDSQRGVVVAHGFGGTWEYDGADWLRIETAQGPNSQWHSMVYDEARGVTVLFGGIDEDGEPIKGSWIYDGAFWYQE